MPKIVKFVGFIVFMYIIQSMQYSCSSVIDVSQSSDGGMEDARSNDGSSDASLIDDQKMWQYHVLDGGFNIVGPGSNRFPPIDPPRY